MKQVYLDHASTTPIDPRVLKAMMPYLSTKFGNPSSLHTYGREAKKAVEDSRKKMADIIGVNSKEVFFTSGGTESDNMAILGIARANKEKGKHIIVSCVEHKAILDACKMLEKEGFSITYLKVNKKGFVSLKELRTSIRRDTILVSIIYANNEIGTIQPIREISKIIRENKLANPIFHSDAAQATGMLPIDVNILGVDCMSIISSKIYGPKGIGLLYVSKRCEIEPIMAGGGQQRGLRSGTEDVASIVGFSEAFSITEKNRTTESLRLKKLRDYFLTCIKRKIKDISVNGDTKKRLPNNINVSIKGAEGESMILLLDSFGVYCATGSACSSFDHTPSNVLVQIGLPLELAHCSLRFTLGRHTKKSDIDYVMKVLPECIKKIRTISSIDSN